MMINYTGWATSSLLKRRESLRQLIAYNNYFLSREQRDPDWVARENKEFTFEMTIVENEILFRTEENTELKEFLDTVNISYKTL